MSSWKECKLGVLITHKKGFAFKSKDFKPEGHRVVKVKDFTSNSIDISKCEFLDESIANQFYDYKLKINDIIIATVGSWPSNPASIVGKVIKVPKNAKDSLLNQNAVRLRSTEKINQLYLYYKLRTTEFSDYLIAGAQGSANQASITLNDIFNYSFELPPLEEQKAIAEILSSLDDKIDLLHRQNQTLESLAQTLFRQWFIEEAKEEWEIGKLPDEFDFRMGLSPSGSTYNEEQNGMPMFQGNADFEFRFPSNRVYTTYPKRIAERFDTLISVRAPVGAQNMAKEKCCIGRGVASFRYKFDNSFYTYTYYKMHSLMEEIKQFNETGTVFGSIGKSDFEAIEIAKPPFEYVAKFQNEVKSIDDKIILNCEQIKSLENLRDTLLPKLLSGEVRVKI